MTIPLKSEAQHAKAVTSVNVMLGMIQRTFI